MRKLFLAASVCALALGAAPTVSARADDAPKEAAPAKAAIQWVEGWAAGRAAAAKSGKLMFVYVHRTTPS